MRAKAKNDAVEERNGDEFENYKSPRESTLLVVSIPLSLQLSFESTILQRK